MRIKHCDKEERARGKVTRYLIIVSRAVASWFKASSLGLGLRNARWFESSWEKKYSHKISAGVWDRCPPSIVMHLGSYGYLASKRNEGDNVCEMGPGSSTESYPAFARIGLRENPGKTSTSLREDSSGVGLTGSVARSGWFRDGNRNRSPLTKRHIGSLARLGWLPAFRSSRYSRSGRASPAPLAPADDEDDKAAAPRSALADARHTFASGDRILYH
ncbi:hypothetical protein ANN_14382 [Periplaneta americana]|uniref:Uncharacterized protein n=1 Tax=Periplaneta americana TaxID=6978 RepID=A0ABQ8SXR5_PERAM|nr:hypothetical protein ANN_14382 [Periplaneta americana]